MKHNKHLRQPATVVGLLSARPNCLQNSGHVRRPSKSFNGILRLITAFGLTLWGAVAATDAAMTSYTDRAVFTAATGANKTIGFATNDTGDPITTPAADTALVNYSLSGVTFDSVRSYYNQFVYTYPNATIKM